MQELVRHIDWMGFKGRCDPNEICRPRTGSKVAGVEEPPREEVTAVP
jgi:hypothetical protein